MVTKVYRGRLEIIAEILSTINKSGSEGISRTSIMYKSFLSYAQLKEYLLFLVENDLINEIHQRVKIGNEKFIYRITGKGYRLLHLSQEIERLVSLD